MTKEEYQAMVRKEFGDEKYSSNNKINKTQGTEQMSLEKLNEKQTKKDEVIVAQDFTAPAGDSTEQIIASQMAKLEARLKAQFAKATSNSISLGVTVIDLESKDGAEILDKATKVPLVDNWGNPRRYADKYYASFSFNGGCLKQEVKQAQYNQLSVGSKYFAIGRLGEISSFGDTIIAPIFSQFEALDI